MVAWRWVLRLSVALITLACVLQGATAVGGGELAVEIASLDTDGADEAIAVVSVVDDSGRPLLGLTNENFAARVGGSPVSIGEVTAAVNSDIGVAVVLAVDVSGSMEGDPLAQSRRAARTFVEGLEPADSVALVTFGDDAKPTLGFTIDRAAAFAALDALRPAGDTALYQATSISAYVAALAETQRKAVILLSDGVDFGNRSAVSREESLTQAAALGVPFFTVGLGTDIDRTYLEELAQGTGGRFLETPTPQGLSELFRAIGDFLRSQYVVILEPSRLAEGQDQPLMLEIEVTLADASGTAREALPILEVPPETAESPAVMVQGLVAGAEIDAPVELSVEVTGDLGVETVRVTVDGSVLAEFTSPPYRAALDPAGYALGGHVLRVEAIGTAGAITAIELPFEAAAPLSEGGGPSPGLLAVGAVLVLLAGLGAAGLLAIARRRPGAETVATRVDFWSPRRHHDPEPWQPPASEAPASEFPALSDEPLGRLVVAAGPRQGEVLEIGTRPRRIGSALYCDLVLADENGGIASEEARTWVSEGRLMYHKLTRLTAFASDGPTGGWLVLQDGEEVQVGPHRLVFELLSQDDSITEALRQLEGRSPEQPLDERKQTSLLDVAFRATGADPQSPEAETVEQTETEVDSD